MLGAALSARLRTVLASRRICFALLAGNELGARLRTARVSARLPRPRAGNGTRRLTEDYARLSARLLRALVLCIAQRADLPGLRPARQRGIAATNPGAAQVADQGITQNLCATQRGHLLVTARESANRLGRPDPHDEHRRIILKRRGHGSHAAGDRPHQRRRTAPLALGLTSHRAYTTRHIMRRTPAGSRAATPTARHSTVRGSTWPVPCSLPGHRSHRSRRYASGRPRNRSTSMRDPTRPSTRRCSGRR